MKRLPAYITFFLSVFLFSEAMSQEAGRTGILKISSPAFENNKPIPKKYTCDGADVSIPLEWLDIPQETQSLAVIMDDPDAPMGTFVHWVVWNIPIDGKIEENSVPGTEGQNSARGNSYMGPCPPSGTHRYFFKRGIGTIKRSE